MYFDFDLLMFVFCFDFYLFFIVNVSFSDYLLLNWGCQKRSKVLGGGEGCCF